METAHLDVEYKASLNRGAAPDKPRVSVIIIFLNTGQFIQEAIESVFAQTFPDWELLLVDDGSTDKSTQIARLFADRYPERVLYLEHAGHQNHGKSASRNLGLRHASGEYIAFLDADDVWLPSQIEQQVAILEAQPRAAMVYGSTYYWYSWSGKDQNHQGDFVYDLGVPPNTLIEPPELFNRFFLEQSAAIPSPCSILVRRQVFTEIGNFEERFQGIYNIYEDQTFYAKVCLQAPVFVADERWGWYRQHSDSSCAVVEKDGQEYAARSFFINWLAEYLSDRAVTDPEMWRAIRHELWRCQHPGLDRIFNRSRQLLQRFYLAGRQASINFLPAPIRRWVSARWRGQDSVPAVGRVRFGDLRRLEPFSRDWGFDRGLPVDRYYIEQFLLTNNMDIQGHVLEIMDDTYTRQFGGDRVSQSDVLGMESTPQTTIIGDITSAEHIPADSFDCIILTQTLHLIYDIRAALMTVYRILKPGGVLLLTLPGISQISRYDMDRWGDYWRFTTRSAQRLLEEVFPPNAVQTTSHGNILAATAFLFGLAAHELRLNELEVCDPDYQVLITVRAVKPILKIDE